jgi:hypothetical protein
VTPDVVRADLRTAWPKVSYTETMAVVAQKTPQELREG